MWIFELLESRGALGSFCNPKAPGGGSVPPVWGGGEEVDDKEGRPMVGVCYMIKAFQCRSLLNYIKLFGDFTGSVCNVINI